MLLAVVTAALADLRFEPPSGPRPALFAGIGVCIEPGAARPVGLFVDTGVRTIVDAGMRYGPEVGAHLQVRVPGLSRVEPWLLARVGGGAYTVGDVGFVPWVTASAQAGIGVSRGLAWRAGLGVEKNLSPTLVPGGSTSWYGGELFGLEAIVGGTGRFDGSAPVLAVDASLRFLGPVSWDY